MIKIAFYKYIIVVIANVLNVKKVTLWMKKENVGEIVDNVEKIVTPVVVLQINVLVILVFKTMD